MSGLLSLKWNNHSSVFLNLLENLRINELYCDATIVCQGKFFPVHKFVLSTCSEYFEEIFSRIECKHPFIIMKDIEIPQLEALLNYMYKGEINVLQDYLSGLIKAAEALKVKGLAVPDQVDSEKESNVKKRCNSSPEVQNKKFSKVENYKLSNSVQKHFNKNAHQVNNASKNCQEENSECGESETALNSREKADNLEEYKVNVKSEPVDDDFQEALPKEDDSLNFASLLPGEENCEQAKESDSEESFSSHLPSSHPLYSVSDSINNSTLNNHEENHLWQDIASTSTEETLQTIESLNSTLIASSLLRVVNEVPFPSSSLRTERDNKKGYKCTQCSFVTKWKCNLRTHLRRAHTGEKPYRCSFCAYRSCSSDSLKVHIRTHTGEKPYQCPLCPHRTAAQNNLARHIRRQHPFIPTDGESH